MKNQIYWHGIPGSQWGIWDHQLKAFRDDVREDTPMLAQARLYQILGQDTKLHRYEARQLPQENKTETEKAVLKNIDRVKERTQTTFNEVMEELREG